MEKVNSTFKRLLWVGMVLLTFLLRFETQAQTCAGTVRFPAPAFYLANVPEASQYNLVYTLPIPDGDNNWDTQAQIPYTTNNTAALANTPFDRVAYVLELTDKATGASKWVWVSFDKVTNQLTLIGLPTDGTVFQQKVTNMNVFASSNAGVTPGIGITTGNIEFWSKCYSRAATLAGIGGSSANFDYNDNPDGAINCFGSFQIHNYGANQSLLSFNAWSIQGSAGDDLGIGNSPDPSRTDWTQFFNSNTYSVKNLYILMRPLGECPKASLGDKVFNDLDKDGIQDANEPGVAGVTVNLYNCNGTTVLATTTTDANGIYSFTNLAPGSYSVEFVKPDGFTFTTQNVGANDAIDSDADAMGKTACVTLAAGDNNTTVDAGIVAVEAPKASLGDKVFNDLDKDGIQDANEPGIANVAVNLYKCGESMAIANTTTDANGNYSFTNLAPGSYYVEFSKPADFIFTMQNAGANDALDSDADAMGKTACVTLAAGDNNTTVDAGLYQVPASLGDFVFNDLNGNGIQEMGEPGVAGVTVNLYNCNGNTILATTTTDANGSYSFTNLTPGGYYVEFVKPDGFTFTTQDAGTDDAIDSDADAMGKTACVNLAAGDNNITVDAGIVAVEAPKASLGDKVFNDLDKDGIQDANEPGVAGVTVTLYNCDDNMQVGASVVTDANGNYSFTNLTPGSYYVVFTNLPANFTFSPQDQGGNDALDSDADAMGKTACVVLAAGQNNTTVDAGIYEVIQPASLGDKVFEDLNGNGVQDPNEPGIANVTVTLYNCTTNTVVATTTTNANGIYAFTDLAPGSYYVIFTAPAGFTVSPQNQGGDDALDSDANAMGKTECVTLAAGENNTTVDAGLYRCASLGDFVFDDLNGNGVQDAGEPGIGNVTVTVFNCTSATQVATTTTTANGSYTFNCLAPGSYYVVFTKPATYNNFTTQDQGDDTKDSDADATGKTACVTLTSGQTTTTVDAGLIKCASLGDFVFRDANNNGVQDAGELGVAGVTVTLYNCNSTTPVTTTTTGTDGSYKFNCLAPGSYYVVFTKPAGFSSFSPKDAGADDLDSDADAMGKTECVTLTSGQNNTTVDAGLVPCASLGDRVFEDLNGNGIQDAGEPGVANVTVKVFNCNSTTVVATTTTNEAGFYSFSCLAPGSYYVEFSKPAGFSSFTTRDATDDNNDSDADAMGKTGCITLLAGQNNITVDAGLIKCATLGDRVFNDLNSNGIQDAGEPGVAGVSVKVYTCNTTVALATVTTDASGNYSFPCLAPGSYYVIFSKPAGFTFTGRDLGGNDALDSDADPMTGKTICVNLKSGETNNTVDAGLKCNTSIGDFVFNDLNANGIQNAGEPGVAGVTVKLYNCNSTTAIATTTTDAAGKYSFNCITAGSYYVGFSNLPAGFILTAANIGTNDLVDSDPNTFTGKTACYTIPAGGSNITIDAGIYKPACGQFRTQTPGGWGAKPSGGNPGAYQVANFPTAFPNGVVIGSKFTLTFTSAQAVINFLPSGSTARPLTRSLINPTTQDEKNVLAQHVLALTLNVGYDAANPAFAPATTPLGYAIIASGTFKGFTVLEFLAIANQVLGGNPSIYSVQSVLQTAAAINENNVDGTINKGFLVCPTGINPKLSETRQTDLVELQVTTGGNVRAFPNPYREKVSFNISATESGNSSLEIYNILGQKVSTPFRGYMEKGSVRTIEYNASNNAGGTLIYRFTNGNKMVTGKIVSMK